jgi:hypothetical protein
MNKILLIATIATGLAMPSFASVPAAGPTAHSPARHGPLHHKRAKRPMSMAQKANTNRIKECGRRWKADKAAGKTGAQKWPQYWSACSKRLKG